MTLSGTDHTVPLTYGEDLLEVQIERNGEAVCNRVTVAGWDPLRIDRRIGETTESRVEPPLSSSISPEALGGSGRRYLTGRTASTNQHLDAAAQAELDRCTAYETVLRGIADGDTRLQPGTSVDVVGIAPELEGRFVLSTVAHSIDGERGFVSEISSAVPPALSPSDGVIATLGTVSRVDDPEAVGRVKVLLSAYGDIESPWLHVISPGAGTDKGLAAVPDVDDTVLLLCSDRKPEDAIVLGGLYGMDGPVDSGVDGNTVQRYMFRTPSGQQIQLDEENHSVSLTDSTGSRIDLSPDRVYLHAATDLEIEAPGQSIIIRGQNIDFQRG
jgi:phage baseplate assembly protein gpV